MSHILICSCSLYPLSPRKAFPSCPSCCAMTIRGYKGLSSVHLSPFSTCVLRRRIQLPRRKSQVLASRVSGVSCPPHACNCSPDASKHLQSHLGYGVRRIGEFHRLQQSSIRLFAEPRRPCRSRTRIAALNCGYSGSSASVPDLRSSIARSCWCCRGATHASLQTQCRLHDSLGQATFAVGR